ncbi:MAG: YdcF family protein [Bacteroidota bacterium]
MVFNKAQVVLLFKRLFLVAGCVFFFIVGFAFTTGPFYLYYWLGKSNSEYHFAPKHLIILGGAGYPSATALMRSYYAAELFKKNSSCDIYVCQPSSDNLPITASDVYKISKDLITRGVDSSKIILEYAGKNTRDEAMSLLSMNANLKKEACVLVTGPEHMKRAIATFRKLGFENIGGEPTFDLCGPANLYYNDKDLGGRKSIPSIGQGTQLRYQFWNHVGYQIICYRELFALGWYWLRGWI